VSTATSAAPSSTLGARVRTLREGLGLSLRDLSGRSGVSAPMLSQVERGETSPTVAVAERIASGLDLSLSQLLRLDEDPPVRVVRAGGGPVVARAGRRYSVLTPDLPGQRASVSRHVLEAGASTGDDPLHEAGSSEFAWVEEGRVRLVVDGRAHELGEGDSATFDADLPHRFENPGPGPATFLSVVCAGLRRS
jgi:transcriptional regulator with XRE-family HTH domain